MPADFLYKGHVAMFIHTSLNSKRVYAFLSFKTMPACIVSVLSIQRSKSYVYNNQFYFVVFKIGVNQYLLNLLLYFFVLFYYIFNLI